jgi:phosphatidylserine/phosphatidylglycerophosphate/cardiolipin synthase-like enzyme
VGTAEVDERQVKGMVEVRTLTDGGQTAMQIAEELGEFLGAAQRSLDLALYDVRLSSPVADPVAGAITDAHRRGVAVRIAYNGDHQRPVAVPPPPRTDPSILESLGVLTCAIPGVPDLMHHKYAVRDGESVWTGSANWTEESWTREENVIVVVSSEGVAAAYARNFEELWSSRSVARSGRAPTRPVGVGASSVRPWFSPGQGSALAHRIAKAIGRARERVRIASPVITSAPILGTLAEVLADGRLDAAGVVDATQMIQVVHQWHANGNSAWKLPLLAAVLGDESFTGKRSTPYAPGSLHDFMHAKVTVADDTVFAGSYNLSHSGELNAENVLEIRDRAIADRLAAYVDEVRARYGSVELPQ